MGLYTESVRTPLVGIGPDAIDVSALVEAVTDGSQSDGRHGAVVTFLGLVRNHNLGRSVRYLEYEAYEPLALRIFAQIVAETDVRWSGARLALHHRVGRLEIGEVSVVIAASSPHRADAFAACRYAIERVKQIAPIWKREYFDGGDVWIEGATADPADERARLEAERVACA
jgi:molybdopterin synthase catalytic subunit